MYQTCCASGPERTQEEESHQIKCGYERNYIQARAHEGKGLQEGEGGLPPAFWVHPAPASPIVPTSAASSLSASLPRWFHHLGSMSACAIFMSGGWRAGASCIPAGARSTALGEEVGMSGLASLLDGLKRTYTPYSDTSPLSIRPALPPAAHRRATHPSSVHHARKALAEDCEIPPPPSPPSPSWQTAEGGSRRVERGLGMVQWLSAAKTAPLELAGCSCGETNRDVKKMGWDSAARFSAPPAHPIQGRI
ncbi:hypothetical protein B0H14DRAFT_908467 [Mycena olivaceomarginata]|nr:hypothetical protein B0H14DRAFT_908467 [Mycena olivaceomarginata]